MSLLWWNGVATSYVLSLKKGLEILSLRGECAAFSLLHSLHFQMLNRPEDSVKESCVSVADVVDIEENIWSPRYTGPVIMSPM